MVDVEAILEIGDHVNSVVRHIARQGVSICKDCILQLVWTHTIVSTVDASLSDIAGNARRLSGLVWS